MSLNELEENRERRVVRIWKEAVVTYWQDRINSTSEPSRTFYHRLYLIFVKLIYFMLLFCTCPEE